MKLFYFVAEDYYFCSHRLQIAKSALAAGYDVTVLTQVNDHAERIQEAGFNLIDITIDRSSTGILNNLNLLWRVLKVIRKEKPQILHNVAIKPIVMGTIACRIVSRKTRIVNAFAGLGYAFTSKEKRAKRLRQLLITLYKIIFRSNYVTLLFQNHDDQTFFAEKIMHETQRLSVIPGSGVDINHYQPLAPQAKKTFDVLMVSRLLRDKGIYEYIESSQLLSEKSDVIQFYLAGAPDPKNPSSVTSDTIQAWERSGLIHYLGEISDVRTAFAKADVIVLPSYREGLPKVLLEASACQKAIITCDVPGCRELIQHEENGLLIQPYSAQDLQAAILRLYHDRQLCARIAACARERVVSYFSDQIIASLTLKLYTQVTSK